MFTSPHLHLSILPGSALPDGNLCGQLQDCLDRCALNFFKNQCGGVGLLVIRPHWCIQPHFAHKLHRLTQIGHLVMSLGS
jgi:hypothetical protein